MKNVEEFANIPLLPIAKAEESASLRMLFNFESDARVLRRREIVSANAKYETENLSIREKLKGSNMRMLNLLLSLTDEQRSEIESLWSELRNQEKPEGMEYSEWEKIKLTE